MPDLSDDYAISAHIEGSEAYPSRWADAAAAFRDHLGPRAHLGISYGPSARMAMDHFLPEGEAQGTLIFVHGGYWRANDRASWSHLATGALAQGWAVAMPSYDLCPTVRIAGITQQIAQAVMHAARLNSGPVSLTGHSAGGHLVARMLAPGMLPETVRKRLNHVVPIAPLTDLEPLVHTGMNDDFRMDAGMARAESPVNQPAPGVPVTVWVGSAERPALLDQAGKLARTWGCDHVIVPGEHHFNVIDALADPDSDLIRRLTTPR